MYENLSNLLPSTPRKKIFLGFPAIAESLMKITRNKILASQTTFGIGGKADWYIEAKNQDEIVEAAAWVKEKKIPWFILGGGSNVLIGDKGVRGLVIRIKNSELRIMNDSPRGEAGNLESRIIAGAGVTLAELISFSLKYNLSGLEFLAGIPGTVGGAIVGNAGNKVGSLSQVVEKVTILGQDNKICDLDNHQCQFDYRTSRFKKTKEIILSATFRLKKEKPLVIKEKIKNFLKLRRNHPPGKSAGSIFMNPRLASAGYLIENAGLKGKREGGAVISPWHANWIINLGQAKAKDVIELIRLCKKKVKKDFKVDLKEEIVLLGEF